STYYVTENLNGCESNAVKVILHELDCSRLEVRWTVNDNLVCKGHGQLEAIGSGGENTKLRWYADSTGGDFIGEGEQFQTPELNTSTDFWVEDAYVIDREEIVSNQANTDTPTLHSTLD